MFAVADDKAKCRSTADSIPTNGVFGTIQFCCIDSLCTTRSCKQLNRWGFGAGCKNHAFPIHGKTFKSDTTFAIDLSSLISEQSHSDKGLKKVLV
jgi:hypothetical protein